MAPLLEKLRADGKVDGKRVSRRTPVGRLGKAVHIARAMLFLAPERTAFVTGIPRSGDRGELSRWF